MLAVTVRFDVTPGREDAFLARVRQQAADSLAREPACSRFDVCTPQAGAAQVFLYEIYDDAAAFDVHLNSAHFLAFNAETEGWTTSKTVERWLLP
jgi:autoinducer 2-degrading protein